MLHARPECPDGYYLYYMRDQQRRFTMVWLMARVEPEDGADPKKHVDRKVALISEDSEGESFMATLVVREGEDPIVNTNPQELVTAVCAIDRMGVK